MKIALSDKIIAWLTLLSGLSISAVAVYYSVAGLIGIFAAAVVPIAVMGVVLEVSKLIATVWLKQNWLIAPKLIRTYLLVAVSILMMITSMGIFGYLSKAHLDQAVPTGDIAAQVSLIDEKIKTERENIDAARKALTQMDQAVDQLMARSDTEQGAQRAANLRRSQTKERNTLQSEIASAQKRIADLNDQRAPIAKELRKVEAEVGPIKYIAAMIYGDNPEQNLLERAVRWVIIIIVVVFDPLAVILLLASQYSFIWFRQQKESVVSNQINRIIEEPKVEPYPVQATSIVEPPSQEEKTEEVKVETPTQPEPKIEEEFDVKNHPYLFKTGGWVVGRPPVVYGSNTLVKEPVVEKVEEPVVEKVEEPVVEKVEEPVTEVAVEGEPEFVDAETADEKIAMKKWKEANPDDTIHRQRRLYNMGLIEQLPWNKVEELDEEFAEANAKKKNSYMIKENNHQVKKQIKD